MKATDGLRFEQLRRLTEISRALTYTTSLDQVLRLATDRAAEVFDADRALLILADEQGLLRVAASCGVELDLADRFRQPVDESLAQRLRALLGVSEREQFVGVPLVVHGAVTGLLAVVRPGPEPCGEEEEWLLSAVADQVAVALENARLAEEVREARRQRAEAVDGAGAANDARDRALATLSHDLRSPLNAIDSLAELLEMEILGPVTDRQRDALGRVRVAGRHLLAVLENVLEMARIEAGVTRPHSGGAELRAVLDEAALMVRHTAEANRQALTIEPGPTLVAAVDPDRLRQVLINLIGNAVKYTPQNGAIRLAVAEAEVGGARWALVSVRDTGPGIPTDSLERIFQPYYRVPSGATAAAEGAGLGLAISRQLVREMGGDIEVESELGQGSTFTVRVPLRG